MKRVFKIFIPITVYALLISGCVSGDKYEKLELAFYEINSQLNSVQTELKAIRNENLEINSQLESLKSELNEVNREVSRNSENHSDLYDKLNAIQDENSNYYDDLWDILVDIRRGELLDIRNKLDSIRR